MYEYQEGEEMSKHTMNVQCADRKTTHKSK